MSNLYLRENNSIIFSCCILFPRLDWNVVIEIYISNDREFNCLQHAINSDQEMSTASAFSKEGGGWIFLARLEE